MSECQNCKSSWLRVKKRIDEQRVIYLTQTTNSAWIEDTNNLIVEKPENEIAQCLKCGAYSMVY